jgi:hypothetical protein
MTLPKWNDPKLKAGTMIRTALWLISEIGLGNSFTKEKHRQAFSGVAQADRRLRDLRNYGWVIHTNLEDVTLNSNEQRFVAIGQPVWEVGARRQTVTPMLKAKIRMEVFAASDYQCVICGVAGGEAYTDAPQMTAVLSVARRSVILADGQLGTMYVSECKRCRAGMVNEPIDMAQLLENVRVLDDTDRAVFAQWVERGRRGPLDRAWTDFRRLSRAAQDEIRRHLNEK